MACFTEKTTLSQQELNIVHQHWMSKHFVNQHMYEENDATICGPIQ